MHEGMELVNHGYYHVRLTHASPEDIDHNFGKAMAYWQNYWDRLPHKISSMLRCPMEDRLKDRMPHSAYVVLNIMEQGIHSWQFYVLAEHLLEKSPYHFCHPSIVMRFPVSR